MKTYSFLPHLEFHLLFTYTAQKKAHSFHLCEEGSALLKIKFNCVEHMHTHFFEDVVWVAYMMLEVML